MTDLHTHILPGVDDGAQSMDEALAMLHMQAQQGVNVVALTPHFYKNRESVDDFLNRRELAWTQLLAATKDQECPELVLGAEVAWMPDITEWPELESLCYQGTKMLLVELPIFPWTADVFNSLYNLEGRRGVMPIIAHVERYFHYQKKNDIERLLKMGYPIQVSAKALSKFSLRKKALKLLELYEGLLISDCHNLQNRVPNLGDAMKIVEKKLGRQASKEFAEITDALLTD